MLALFPPALVGQSADELVGMVGDELLSGALPGGAAAGGPGAAAGGAATGVQIGAVVSAPASGRRAARGLEGDRRTVCVHTRPVLRAPTRTRRAARGTALAM